MNLPLAAMLRARSIALVGASNRPGSFGARMIEEVGRSSGQRRVHLVNPRYDSIDGRPCLPSLKHIDEPVDLILLGVGDGALEEQLTAAARLGARGAVVFGSAHGTELRQALRDIAIDAGIALCGPGCMGFINVADGLRATGYVEREQLSAGSIALVTHSGSVFSALLRTRRALDFTLAISSGQELVTTTPDYVEYVLDETDARVIALVLETVRDGPRLVEQLRRAAERDVPVVVLPVGGSPVGAALVTAHSGALAGTRGMWEALAEGTGALLVSDLAELTDTLELLAVGRRARPGGIGIATVHDSGAERCLVADLADELDVPFAPLAAQTLERLGTLLDPGLVAGNPLDLWGTGAGTREQFGAALRAMAADPAVSAVALAVDLVEEYDGDTSYPDAVLDAHTATDAPVVVLSNLASAVDEPLAARLRAAGVPVLEGTRSGLVALRNLQSLADRGPVANSGQVDVERQRRWRARLTGPPLAGAEAFALLADYGLPVVAVAAAADEDAAVAAARRLGYPVVIKTDESGIAHKSDAGGVLLGLPDEDAVRTAYRDLAERLGARVLVCAEAPRGVELALGITRDPQLGPLVVVAAGGVLAELLTDRALALPPLTRERAAALVDGLRIRPLLDGWRGGAAADRRSVVDAVLSVGALAVELGDQLAALDVNPLIAGPSGALVVDALVVVRQKIA
ncbi:MAG TPA: acetate--CoA ligase family protein [Jatrophihabitans sp.]|jgi:acyl-CoA synthetase (NDP forming)|nr:acetate--CoA ligase family protein [Jatrophihabitans sp.]